MDEKTLSFSIQIDGISNEAMELQKITLQLQNLNKEYKDLQKSIKEQGGFASNDQLRQLAAYRTEIDSQKDSLSVLNKVVDSAPDSLDRMKQSLTELKAQWSAGSTEVRENMTPAINELNTQIKNAENSIGVHTRTVGDYEQSIISAGKQLLSFGGVAAIAMKVFNGLKDAVMSTSGAIDFMNITGATLKQILYDISVGYGVNLATIKNTIAATKEMNGLRTQGSER